MSQVPGPIEQSLAAFATQFGVEVPARPLGTHTVTWDTRLAKWLGGLLILSSLGLYIAQKFAGGVLSKVSGEVLLGGALLGAGLYAQGRVTEEVRELNQRVEWVSQLVLAVGTNVHERVAAVTQQLGQIVPAAPAPAGAATAPVRESPHTVSRGTRFAQLGIALLVLGSFGLYVAKLAGAGGFLEKIPEGTLLVGMGVGGALGIRVYVAETQRLLNQRVQQLIATHTAWGTGLAADVARLRAQAAGAVGAMAPLTASLRAAASGTGTGLAAPGMALPLVQQLMTLAAQPRNLADTASRALMTAVEARKSLLVSQMPGFSLTPGQVFQDQALAVIAYESATGHPDSARAAAAELRTILTAQQRLQSVPPLPPINPMDLPD